MSLKNDFLTKNFPNEDSNSIYRPPLANFPHLDREFPITEAINTQNKPIENIRIYITLKKGVDSNIEYKKMILMTSSKRNPLLIQLIKEKTPLLKAGIKISMLKRQIEKEFSDLFPKEPTFICGKLEDEYSYSLSNNSYVFELLKNGDRIYAIPEGFSLENPESLEMHLTTDIQELLFMLKSLEQNICCKLADCSYKNQENLNEILVSLIPLGFSQSRVIVHNIAVVLNKVFATERLNIFEDKANTLIFNLTITLINYWIADLVSNDNFLLSATVDLLEILNKSALFCEQFKSAFIINNLMKLSKLDFISAQTRSRVIKIITYLSKGEFKDFYDPRPISRSLIQGGGSSKVHNSYFEPKNNFKQSNNSYIPSNTSRNREFKPVNQQEISLNYNNNNNNNNNNDNYNSRNYANNQLNSNNNVKKGDNTLINDFVNLLNPENSKEMLIFSVQNLEPTIDSIIDSIIENKEAYLKCLNLIEINMPTEFLPSQMKILETINKYLTETRAIDGLNNKIVTRLLKGFSMQPAKMQSLFYNMLQNHLTMGKFRVDVPTLISMISCPFVRLQELGVKILAELSDPSVNEFLNYDLQFENHIKFLLEISLSKKKSFEFKNSAILAISNLSLKDSLRPQVVYNSGIETLLFHLRNDENLEGQRIAAKGLLNLSIKSRDLKLRIVTELGEEIKKMSKNGLDSIITGYLQTLMQTKENKY